MGIQSMTGFGRGEAISAERNVVAEVKSVNHRFRDINFKMPSHCLPFELHLRKTLEKSFKRGRFDIFLDFRGGPHTNLLDNINLQAAEAFLEALAPVLEKQGYQKQARATDFLCPQFANTERDTQKDAELAAQALQKAIEALTEVRTSEGKALVQAIRSHLDKYKEHLQIVENNVTRYQELVEQKLRKKFEEISEHISIERPRFMQEVIHYMEKMDVQEEITRIHSHLNKLESLLCASGEVGRQVDFLVQELNRETNTIGSKSASVELSDNVVQMKVQLEKIREQGLNLE